AFGRPYEGLEQKVVDLAQRRGLMGRTLFTSFSLPVLRTIRAIRPDAGILCSFDRRSAEMMGGVDPLLDRFQALDGCFFAVERGLMLADPSYFIDRIGSDR